MSKRTIYCIAPNMQRKGVASQLLERACIDAASEGFDFMEAYPKKEFVSAACDFMGPAEMYKKHGFTLYREFENNEIVMRKELK